MDVGKIAAFAASMGLLAVAQTTQAAVLIEQLAPPTSGFSSQITTITGNTHLSGDSRLFLARKQGRISVYDQASGNFSILQDLTPRVASESFNELGLVGLTFDPGYATNGQYYVFLTGRTTPGGPVEAQVIRFTDPSIASGGEMSVWKMDLDGASSHVSGWIDFDASGKLLIGIGDGGVSYTPDIRGTGQNPADWFGSILRIDPHGDDFLGDPALNYAIPADNPDIAGGRDELFVYGVRNPFRNSIGPDGSLIVADVGHNAREEITIIAPDELNRNLGWALREGDIAAPGGGLPPADYLAPGLVYDHSEGAAVIGGFVYRGSAVPELFGHYVFGDQVSGSVWAVRYENGAFVGSKFLLGTIPSLVSFGETADGELVATQFLFGQGGGIFRFVSDGIRPAVPEPASWAMLIAGFALAGAAMRRREGFQAARRPV